MEIRKLNMIRGFAALIVMLSHFSNYTDWFGGSLGHGGGQFGVMIFFILSGFLMSYLYMDKALTAASLNKYFIARFARVAPLFLVVVVSSFLLSKLGVTGFLYDIPSTKQFISHFLLIEGEEVLWTIGPEVQFYFLLPLIWLMFARNHSVLAYLSMAIVLVVLIFLNFPRPTGHIFGFPFDLPLFSSIQYFFVGIILGRIYNRSKIPALYKSNWLLLSVLLIPMLYPKIFSEITGFEHHMWQDLGVLFVVSTVFFCLVFLVPDNNQLLANKLGDYLGQISYSLYLLHMPVLWQVQKLQVDSILIKLLVFISTTILLSHVSYYVLELPSSRLIRSWQKKTA